MHRPSIQVLQTALAIVLFAFAAGGCSSQSSRTQNLHHKPNLSAMVMTGDPQQVAALGRRFAWHPSLSKVVPHHQLEPNKVIELSHRDIAEVLGAKGYVLVAANESPDFLVGFGVALDSSMSDDEILAKTGLVAGLPNLKKTAAKDSQTEHKGSMYIGFFADEHQHSVWRVLAQGYTDLSQSDKSRQQAYQAFVARMLNALPPRE